MSQISYGVIHRFLPRLLLWKRTGTKTDPILHENTTVPSWSWMFYDGSIEFLTYSLLKVPKYEILSFGSNQAIKIGVRQFEYCHMDQEHENLKILADTTEVGFICFDLNFAARNESRNCVVVGIRNDDDNEDPDKEYYILVVREKSGEGEYERLGVGRVQARYVSNESRSGILL